MATTPKFEGDFWHCWHYKAGGKCTHQAAPRKLLGCAKCIEHEWTELPRRDPRFKPIECRMFEHTNDKQRHPAPPPAPPRPPK